jgi:nucleoid DNA-binding protein
MNSKELARIISKEYLLSQSLANPILKTILKTIASELKSGRLVRLRNFGTFRARKSHGKLRAKFDDSKNFFKQ